MNVELRNRFGTCTLAIESGHIRIDDVDETIKVVEKVSKVLGTVNQIFDARRIAGREHLIHSVKLALVARSAGNSFADSPAIDLACWAAAQRQIDRAIERVGVREETREVAVVSISDDPDKTNKSQRRIFNELQIEPDEDVLKLTQDKVEIIREAFSISENQLKVSSLQNLVLERIALLSLQQ